MNARELTDDEVWAESTKAADAWLENEKIDRPNLDWPDLTRWAQRSLELAVRRAIATAAQKKLVEWLLKNGEVLYSRHAFPESFSLPIHKLEEVKAMLGVK